MHIFSCSLFSFYLIQICTSPLRWMHICSYFFIFISSTFCSNLCVCYTEEFNFFQKVRPLHNSWSNENLQCKCQYMVKGWFSKIWQFWKLWQCARKKHFFLNQIDCSVYNFDADYEVERLCHDIKMMMREGCKKIGPFSR